MVAEEKVMVAEVGCRLLMKGCIVAINECQLHPQSVHEQILGRLLTHGIRMSQ